MQSRGRHPSPPIPFPCGRKRASRVGRRRWAEASAAPAASSTGGEEFGSRCVRLWRGELRGPTRCGPRLSMPGWRERESRVRRAGRARMRRRLGWATEQGRRRAAVLVAFGSGSWARGGTAPTAVARSEGRGDVAGQCDVGPAAPTSALRRPQQMRRGGANRGSESQSVMSSGGQLACAGLTFFAPSEERLESGLYSRSYLDS